MKMVFYYLAKPALSSAPHQRKRLFREAKNTCPAEISYLLLFAFLRQPGDMRKLTETFLIIETIADDKFIFYRKSGIIRHDIRGTAGRLIEKSADPYGFYIFTCKICILQIFQGISGIYDIFHDENISAGKLRVRLFLDFYRSGRLCPPCRSWKRR